MVSITGYYNWLLQLVTTGQNWLLQLIITGYYTWICTNRVRKKETTFWRNLLKLVIISKQLVTTHGLNFTTLWYAHIRSRKWGHFLAQPTKTRLTSQHLVTSHGSAHIVVENGSHFLTQPTQTKVYYTLIYPYRVQKKEATFWCILLKLKFNSI